MKAKKKKIDASKPLKNKSWERFVVNLLTMNKAQAYMKAGYKQTGDNASKAAHNLLANNNEVSERYAFLLNKHNEELENKGFISRESMIKNAINMMNASMGKVPMILPAKHKTNFFKTDEESGLTAIDFDESYTEEEVQCYDLKSFAAIWDKLMKAMAYYPEDKVKIEVAKINAKIAIDKHTGANKGKNKLADSAKKNYEKRKKEETNG